MKTKFLLIIIALSLLSNIKAQSYNDLWKNLNENLENNLPKSAVTILDEIEQKAVKENNQKELLKTFLYRFKIFYLENDDAVEASIKFAEENISRLQEPERAIFNLVIVSLYEDCQQLIANSQQPTANG